MKCLRPPVVTIHGHFYVYLSESESISLTDFLYIEKIVLMPGKMGEWLMKKVDTTEYVSMLKELTEQGKEVSLLIAGNSMSPFLIHERDLIYFKKPDRELKKGDMVFFQRATGRFVMHRICKVRAEGFYIVGDAQTDIEGPVKREQIFGLITKVNRKGKWIGSGDFWWEFFEHVWINIIPFRLVVLKCYSCFAKSFGGLHRILMKN